MVGVAAEGSRTDAVGLPARICDVPQVHCVRGHRVAHSTLLLSALPPRFASQARSFRMPRVTVSCSQASAHPTGKNGSETRHTFTHAGAQGIEETQKRPSQGTSRLSGVLHGGSQDIRKQWARRLRQPKRESADRR